MPSTNRPAVEMLESRLLRSADLGAYGVLRIEGTAAPDHIYVYRDPTHPEKLCVKMNNRVATFVAANVKEINIGGRAGNDDIRVLDLNGDVLVNTVRMFGIGGSDTLVGGSAKDILSGDEGNDVLVGNAGVDVLHGGVGDDILDGGRGNDQLNGEDGSDTIRGGDGDDKCYGNTRSIAPDSYADAGDRIYGGSGNDQIYGHRGRNFLYGNAGNDIVTGGGGNDVLSGGEGTDTVSGGAGPDTFSNADSASERVGFTTDDELMN